LEVGFADAGTEHPDRDFSVPERGLGRIASQDDAVLPESERTHEEQAAMYLISAARHPNLIDAPRPRTGFWRYLFVHDRVTEMTAPGRWIRLTNRLRFVETGANKRELPSFP
jgi:hypothetical protein